MSEVVEFPVTASEKRDTTKSSWKNDPYYHFIQKVMSTVNSYGFPSRFKHESSTTQLYLKTRENSELARRLRGQ